MAANNADFTTQYLPTTEDLAMVNFSSYENITDSDHQRLKNFQHFNVSVRLMMGLLAISGNLLTVVAIAHYEYLRSCTNYLIAALAIADMFGGFNCLVVLINHLTPMTDETWLKMCAVEFNLNQLSAGLNLGYILLISVDRFIFITFPLRYHSLVTPRLTVGAIVVLFVSAVSHLTTLNFILEEYQQPRGRICTGLFPKYINFSLNLWFYVPTPITVLLYTRIAWIAYRQSRAIEQAQNTAANREYKITKMLSLVLGVYLACYVPQYTIFNVKGYFAPDDFIITERVSSWFWWVNSWANPLIYAWKSKDFKKAFKSLLRLKDPTVYPGMDPTPT